MKAAVKKSNKKRAFTIIELLTVMSVIIILLGLLVPALSMVRRFAKRVMQKNQFHSIEVAMETYNAEWEDYPPSELQDELFQPYCGAMKLCEAMVGQDLLGFHPNSRFLRNDPAYLNKTDLSARRKYLIPGSANAYEVGDLYENVGVFDQNSLVLCDVFPNITPKGTSKLVGMPILYYKADTSKTGHTADPPFHPENIYKFIDNQALVGLGMPWAPPPAPGGEPRHPLFSDPGIFYVSTRNDKIDIDGDGFGDRPYNDDSYILLSSGWDGEYGTDDDMYNFKR